MIPVPDEATIRAAQERVRADGQQRFLVYTSEGWARKQTPPQGVREFFLVGPDWLARYAETALWEATTAQARAPEPVADFAAEAVAQAVLWLHEVQAGGGNPA